MKKLISVIIFSMIMVAMLAGCDTTVVDEHNADKISIVTTIFPEYDWVREITKGNDNVEITMLLNNGVDLHSYQPTVDDIVKIASCDMFVYIGGESDEWVEDALAEATNKDMKVVNLMELLGDAAKVEEIKEGMQESEHQHEHEHEDSKEVSDFEDSEVQDRTLADWEGDWQSGYPLALDGSLDAAFEHMAESGDKTAEEYKEYYTTGYKSDYVNIKIEGNHISFTDVSGKVVESDYGYVNYYIQNWSTGTKAAMYRFEAVDKGSGAPIFIEFNDHIIEPAEAEHFHIRYSNESYDAIVDPENSWPTFFSAALSPEEVSDQLAGHGHGDEEEEEVEYDEHIWLSLKNSEVICQAIADELGKIDAGSKTTYDTNVAEYIKKLDALDKEYQQVVEGAAVKTVIFGDRFPFRYMIDDYGLDYYAAFVGCSAETEASFETIAFLANKIDELGLSAIIQIESANGKIAQTIKENTQSKSQNILVLDSMQSTTSEDVANGTTYFSVMEKNLEVLKEALK